MERLLFFKPWKHIVAAKIKWVEVGTQSLVGMGKNNVKLDQVSKLRLELVFCDIEKNM
jgi:hypothetical protein